jgi:tetratricopeptide (TPR) repeat protein
MKTQPLAAAALVAVLVVPEPSQAGNIAAEVCRKDPNSECLLAWAADPQLIGRIGDEVLRADALQMIASAQAHSGDVESARATYAKALEIMPELGPAPWRDTLLHYKVYSVSLAGDYTLAFHLAEEIDAQIIWEDAYSQIAYAQAKAGDFDAALATANRIGVSEAEARGVRILAYEMIARIQFEAGALAGAIETITEGLDLADREQDRRMRDHYRRNIALACADIGATALALKLASLLDTEEGVVRVLHRTAVAQAKAMDIPAARITIQGISSPTWRAYTMAQVAEVANNAGDSGTADDLFAKALRVARRIPADATSELDSRSTALTRVAGSLVRAGRPKEALGVAAKIANPEERGPVKIAIVKSVVKSENTQAALAVAYDIELARRRAEALSQIAVALAAAGDKAGARATFANAIASAEQTDDQYEKPDTVVAWSLIEIAVLQASTGLAKDATATARSIKIEHQRASALVNVTRTLARHGDVDEALALVENARSPFEKTKLLVSAAFGIAEREQ